MSVFRRSHWISPAALIYAQLAHGFAWVLVLWIAWSGNLPNALYGFAWIYSVALAWVTMAALTMLIHALPEFTGAPWRGETFARWSIALYGCGVALLLFGFLGDSRILPAAGGVMLIALCVYLGTAFATISGAMRMGFGLAWMLGGHAITGTVTRMPRMHSVVGLFAIGGVLLLAAGVAENIRALEWIGGALFAIAALGYAIDTIDIVGRAVNRHRPPQAFVLAGVFWLFVSLALGAGVLSGKPWQQAFAFVLLMGLIGQVANAHVYHTVIRQDLLEARLSWFSVYAFQVAIGVIAYALTSGDASLVARGAVFGITGWIAMIANVLAARTRARLLRY